MRRKVHEKHYFVNRPVAEVRDRLTRRQCEFAEFHCMLVRTKILEQTGLLDEKLLNTREHIDFSLTVTNAGGTIYCEPESVVTYVPGPPFEWSDLPFFIYDIERLREVTVIADLPLLTNILTMIGMLGVMFWLNLELALIAIAIFPLFVFSTATMSARIQKVARQQRKREGAMAAKAAEAIGAIKVVQALSLQSMLEQTFSKHNHKSLNESAQTQKLKAGQERTVEILAAVATALVLWRGVQLVIQEVVSPGDLLVSITYLKVAFKPMRQMAKYTGQIAKATASGERIIDLLEIVPEVQDLRGAWDAPPFRGIGMKN